MALVFEMALLRRVLAVVLVTLLFESGTGRRNRGGDIDFSIARDDDDGTCRSVRLASL